MDNIKEKLETYKENVKEDLQIMMDIGDKKNTIWQRGRLACILDIIRLFDEMI